MRFAAIVLVLAIAYAQKGNETAKPWPKAGKDAPHGGPKPKDQPMNPKPIPNASAPEPKQTPQPPPVNPIPAQYRAAWEACNVAYPNTVDWNNTENFLLQSDKYQVIYSAPNTKDREGHFEREPHYTTKDVKFTQTTFWPSVFCQLGYTLKQQNAKAKCSEICSTSETTDKTEIWSKYIVWSGGAKYFYNTAPLSQYFPFTTGLFSKKYGWNLNSLIQWGVSSPQIGLDWENDPAVAGTCVIGCQLASDAKPAPRQEQVKAGPNVGIGAAVGAGGIILIGGVGVAVSRRLKKNQKAPAQKTTTDATIAI